MQAVLSLLLCRSGLDAKRRRPRRSRLASCTAGVKGTGTKVMNQMPAYLKFDVSLMCHNNKFFMNALSFNAQGLACPVWSHAPPLAR